MDHTASTAGSGDPDDVVRRLYVALATGDRDTLAELVHPDFVGHLAEGMPGGVGGEHRGADAMIRHGWGGIGRHFAARAEPEHVVALTDGRLLVTGRYSGRGRRGGAPVDAAFAHVVTVAGGRVTALDQYTDTARWADAAPPFTTLRLEIVEGLATITLDRPEQGNAIDPAVTQDLLRAVTLLAEHDGLRAVLITGTGPMFSVGGDITVFTDTPPEALPDTLRAMISPFHAALDRLASLDAPVIAAVRGAAAGGGLGVVCTADIVIAAEDAKFTAGYGGIAMVSDGGCSWYLPRMIGLRRAQEMFLTNRRLSAAEALDWGLVTTVVPADEVDAEARRVAEQIAAGPTRSFGAMRRLLRQSSEASLRDQHAAEEDSIVAACRTADTLEGVTAFVERRRPKFTGR